MLNVNKSFIKLPIMDFAGTGSTAGTMLIKVNKTFNIHDLNLFSLASDHGISGFMPFKV